MVQSAKRLPKMEIGLEIGISAAKTIFKSISQSMSWQIQNNQKTRPVPNRWLSIRLQLRFLEIGRSWKSCARILVLVPKTKNKIKVKGSNCVRNVKSGLNMIAALSPQRPQQQKPRKFDRMQIAQGSWDSDWLSGSGLGVRLRLRVVVLFLGMGIAMVLGLGLGHATVLSFLACDNPSQVKKTLQPARPTASMKSELDCRVGEKKCIGNLREPWPRRFQPIPSDSSRFRASARRVSSSSASSSLHTIADNLTLGIANIGADSAKALEKITWLTNY